VHLKYTYILPQGIIQEYACKTYCYNAVNTSTRTEQYLTAHKETNYTDYSK